MHETDKNLRENLVFQRRANQSLTNGERLASVVANWGLGMLALRSV